MKEPQLPPWKRKKKGARPKQKLSPEQVAAARARAAAHQRRYPNLVDNMWAARQKPADLAQQPPARRDFDNFDPDS